MTTLTLNQKEAALRDTVAMPTNENWQQPESPLLNEMLAAANAALVSILEMAKSETMEWGEIGCRVYHALENLTEEFPEADLLCSEACATVALFFALNYDPGCYDYVLYYNV